MGFSGKYCRFTVLTFLFVLCLTIAAAQDNPPVPRGPGRDNSGEFRLLQGALVELLRARRFLSGGALLAGRLCLNRRDG